MIESSLHGAKPKKKIIPPTNACSICGDSGWELDEKTNTARPCRCGKLERERQENKLRFANVPTVYRDITMQSVISKYYTPKGQETIRTVVKMIKYYIDHIDAMQDQGKGLFLWSNKKGSGKTMVAAAIANELMNEYKKNVKFATALDILEEIKSSYNSDSRVYESDLLRDLAEIEILVIDDFGTERVSDWAGEKFYQIINTRYVNNAIIIYTSNHDIRNLKYDDRITNRIIERSYILHFPEESVREVKARIENRLEEC